MKKIVLYAVVCMFIHAGTIAQTYITKNGNIRFSSDASMEKNESVNQQVYAALNATTGDFVFKVLIKSFQFKNALMQEHFNENYMESDKYPNGTFVGKISNIADVTLNKDGIYYVKVEGKLTIHGVTKDIQIKGTLEVTGGKVTGKSDFFIQLTDYKITVPNAVVQKLSNTIEITVSVPMEKFKN
ncbi:MAG: YceI family protein [Bacteroidetes bacterium]|nr:YceI family protein [Bacteroidota bacterium]